MKLVYVADVDVRSEKDGSHIRLPAIAGSWIPREMVVDKFYVKDFKAGAFVRLHVAGYDFGLVRYDGVMLEIFVFESFAKKDTWDGKWKGAKILCESGVPRKGHFVKAIGGRECKGI